MIMRIIIVASLILTLALAEKDSNYYPKGYSNPNADQKMYWKDATNVLDDLSQFSKLYVSFHSCAWSPYGGDGDENACGVTEGEDDAYWYLGNTECFRANAAYALYGVLKGEDDHGCNKHTFINSFLTTYGVETFTQSVQVAGVSFGNSNFDDDNADAEAYPGGVTSQCSYEDADDGADDQSSPEVSYGLGCSGKSFVEKAYQGAYCNGQEALKVTNHLSSFNKDLKTATCIEIYDQSNNGNNDDGDALDLLYNSRACDIREFPKQCPDPYGMLKSFARANERSTAKSNHPLREMVKTIFSWILLIWGVILIGVSIFLLLVQKRRKAAREKVLKESRQNSRRSSKSVDTFRERGNRTSGKKKDSKSEKSHGFLKRIRTRLICRTDKEAREYN